MSVPITLFASRYLRHIKGHNRSGMVQLTGSATIGSSGAVSSYDSPGFKIQKNDGQTGRYRIQLLDQDGVTYSVPTMTYSGTTVTTPFGFQAIHVSVVSAQASAALTTDSAISWAIRNYKPELGYFEVQFYRSVTSTTSETHVDTDVESGGKFFIDFQVKTSSAVP